MTPHGTHGTAEPCGVCGGECREPLRLPPIPDRYPFLPSEVIAEVNELHEPQPEAPSEPAPTRGRRRGEDRARRLDEHTARTPGDDR
jgi:hypothetical protein